VFQVAAVYAVVAWLLVQIIVSIKEPLGLPIWTDSTPFSIPFERSEGSRNCWRT
jgi:hypothetical protein